MRVPRGMLWVVVCGVALASCVTPYDRSTAVDRQAAYDGSVRGGVRRLDQAIGACVTSENQAADAYESAAAVVARWRATTAVFTALAGGTGATLALLAQSARGDGQTALAVTGGVLVGVAPILSAASLQILEATGAEEAKTERLARAQELKARRGIANKDFAALQPLLSSAPSSERDAAEHELSKLASRVLTACAE